jgi:hypothetical protein
MGQMKPEGLAGDLANYNLYKNVNLNENLYRLDVAASQININSNIMTTEEQIYRSPVVVGGNKINYLVSLDPNVTFLENISDANPGTNGLIVRAVEISPPSDTIAAIAYKAAPTNLLLWDPLAFGLELGVVDSSSNLQIGDYRETEKVLYGSDFGFSIDPSTCVAVAFDNNTIYVKFNTRKSHFSDSRYLGENFNILHDFINKQFYQIR